MRLSESTLRGLGWGVLWLALAYSAIGLYGSLRGSREPAGMCLEDVKVMCWNELTQSPKECR